MLTKFWFKIAGKKRNTLLGEVWKYLINTKTYIKLKTSEAHTRRHTSHLCIYACTNDKVLQRTLFPAENRF